MLSKFTQKGVRMWPFNWITKDKRINHNFDDEDRSLSVEIRRKKSEIATQKQQLEMELLELQLEREKIEIQNDIEDAKAERDDMLSELAPAVDDGMNGMLMTILSKLLTGGVPQQQQSVNNPIPVNNVMTDTVLNYLKQIKEGRISKRDALKFLDKNWEQLLAQIPI